MVPALCASVARGGGLAQAGEVALALDTAAKAGAAGRATRRCCAGARNSSRTRLKYSPDGGRVGVRVADERERVRIEVPRPRGLGIPPSEQERVFEKFYRLDPEMDRGIGGLRARSLHSRKIVEQMDGSLSVHSAPGVRLDLHVLLPRRKTASVA